MRTGVDLKKIKGVRRTQGRRSHRTSSFKSRSTAKITTVKLTRWFTFCGMLFIFSSG